MSGKVDNVGSSRVLRFLRHGAAAYRQASAPGKLLLEMSGRGVISVAEAELAVLLDRQLLQRDEGHVRLTPKGMVLADSVTARTEALGGAQREIEIITVAIDSEAVVTVANLAESPISQLARRKGKDGKPFLTPAEVGAGERLRADYTRGQIMPRLGANWIASVASAKRSGSGGSVELTDAALAARQRVEKAITAVGPELSGVLIDICCFLKGLELVEAERGWPVRSAKVVLKSALGVLSRHYNPAQAPIRRSFTWGAPDYRPAIGVTPSV